MTRATMQGVPYKRKAVCDECGTRGAFVYLNGEQLCARCTMKAIERAIDLDK